MQIIELTPKEIMQEVKIDLLAGLTPFVKSSPGLGKSSIARQIAKEWNLKYIDVRLSMHPPEDLTGLPFKNSDGTKAGFLPFEDLFPVEGDELPVDPETGHQYDGWFINLDEFNSCSKMMQAAAYKLALDKMVGMKPLHECSVVMACGNLETDKAIVNSMSTAMQSRLTHYTMKFDFTEFMENAVKKGWDARVTSFLEFKPSLAHRFNPDHSDNTFPCPRTWDFLQTRIANLDNSQVTLAGAAACVDNGAAAEFTTFLKHFDSLPSYSAVVNSPKTVDVPMEAGKCYAMSGMLLEKFDKDDFDALSTYMARMSSEFQIVFFRGLIQRYPEVRRMKNFQQNTREVLRYLVADDEDMKAAA